MSSWNLGTLTSWNPLGHSRPVTGLIYHFLQAKIIISWGLQFCETLPCFMVEWLATFRRWMLPSWRHTCQKNGILVYNAVKALNSLPIACFYYPVHRISQISYSARRGVSRRRIANGTRQVVCVLCMVTICYYLWHYLCAGDWQLRMWNEPCL